MENIILDTQRTGIVLGGSPGNFFEDNIVSSNIYGISLDAASLSNRISRNTFINSQNVHSKSATSIWSNAGPLSYTYLGNTTWEIPSRATSGTTGATIMAVIKMAMGSGIPST
ncbi:MAG: NosD domain-containing protein [Methanomicrobiales archaeon]